ncbi:MAG: response regulator [Pseudomonadota bacterium]
MEAGTLVYVVDDDPTMLVVSQEMLAGEGCAVAGFASAQACLDGLDKRQPDLFLLDVRMSGMDGYALCRQLKGDPRTADIPVIFVSGLDSIEARLAGYDAGGEDFIVKPFEPEVLLRKIEVSRRISTEKRALREQAGFAQRTAFSAMTSMGELGTVLDFLRKSFACADARALAGALLDALSQYGLEGAVQVRLGDETLTLSADGSNLPLETSVLNHVRDQGRIFEFGRRSVHNFGGITLLVKNTPVEDIERCGRLRDNLSILIEGADARRQSIEVENRNRRTREGIGAALADIHAALDVLRQQHQRARFQESQLMIDIQEGMTKFFVALGLSEQQENQMYEFVRQQFARLQDGLGDTQQISAQLEQMAQRLRALANG